MSLNIGLQLSISVWIKIPPPVVGYHPHLFTFPRSEGPGISFIQVNLYDTNTYFYCRETGIGFYGNRPKTEDWQHVVITVRAGGSGNKVALYSNGKFVEEKVILHRLGFFPSIILPLY